MWNRRNTPLDSLPVFEAAMRHMSFAAAANELNVTASAVSQRIKSLEDMLGVMLFERLPHGLRSTEAARLYLLEIRPALERLHAASARISAQTARRPDGRGRRLSVDMLPALASTRFAPIFRRFRNQFPDVDLQLTTSPAVADPGRDGFDCCIRYGPGGWNGVQSTRLAGEHVFPVASPSFAADAASITELAHLLDVPLIDDLMPLGWVEWLSAFGVELNRLKSELVFSDSSLAQQAAAQGLGVYLGRSVLVSNDLHNGRLVRILDKELLSPFSYWLVRPLGKHDALVDLFAEWLVEEALTQIDLGASTGKISRLPTVRGSLG
ncbi:MAG: LysR substrate-binding domain-containing protein [Pseudorhodoplanes sp.]|uniref:LysR substrate-binding domain-containing protein n=1 Tax=Pseudorhodoplanes sp. TaxID=1934341 RepID=UPI003D0DAF9E